MLISTTHTFPTTSTLISCKKPTFHPLNSHLSVNLLRPPTSFPLIINPIKIKRVDLKMNQQLKRGFGPVCYSAPISFTTTNLQWISTVCSLILMFAKGTAIPKSFLVPIIALQAPATLVSWIKGEYGIWTAFLALLVRLFFYIPGELELPFIALLMVILLPYQIANLRGRQEGVVLSLVIAAFLAFQHFTRVGGLRKSFDQGSIIATLAVLCVVTVPCVLLI